MNFNKMKFFLKKNLELIIFVIFIIIIFQTIYFSKFAESGQVLNYYIKKEEKTSDNIVFSMISNLMSDYVKKDSKIVFLGATKNQYYACNGITLFQLRLDFFDSIVEKGVSCFVEEKNDDYYIDLIKKNDIDYVLYIGRNTYFLDKYTKKDITLFEVENNNKIQLNSIFDINIDLYDLYTNYKNIDEKYFNENLEEIKQQIIYYYDFEGIDFIRNFAITSFDNRNYNLALSLTNFYLENVDYINDELNIKVGDYYFELEEYDKAKFYYNVCLRNLECDKKYVNKKINEADEELRKRGE